MDTFSKWHIHNASKEVFLPKKFLNFMHGYKSAILAIFPFCQNGTFEPVMKMSSNCRALEIKIRNHKVFDIIVYLLKNGYLLRSFSLLFIIPLARREVYWNNIGKEWCSFKKRTRLEISLAATLNESGKIDI